jgi:PAS domain S-box-containing protein
LKQGISDFVLRRNLSTLPRAVQASLDKQRQYYEQKQAQILLGLAEERYRMLTEMTTDFGYCFYVAPDGAFTLEWISETSTRIIGYSLYELYKVNGDLLQSIHPSDQAKVIKHYECLLQNQADVCVFRLLSKQGEWCWLRDSGQPGWDATQKRVVRMYGAVQDITAIRTEHDTLHTQSQILQNLAEGVIVTEDGHIIYTNPAFDLMFGYPLGSMVGMSVFELDDTSLEESRAMSQLVTETILREGKWHGEFKNRRKDGSSFISRAHVTSLVPLSESSEKKLWITVREDVTEYKRTSIALQKREQEFRALVENSPDIIARFNKDLYYDYINPAMQALSDISEQEFSGAGVRGFAGTPLLDWHNKLRQVFATGQPQTIQGNFITRHGPRFFQVAMVPESDSGHVIKHVLAISRDVTELKLAEQRLAAEKERLAVTLASIGDGVIATDTLGRVNLINRVAEMLTGWPKHEALGQSLHQVLQVLDRPTGRFYPDLALQVLQSASKFDLEDEALLLSQDQVERLIEGSVMPIANRDSTIIGTVVVFSDITRKRKIEEELLKADKLDSIGLLAGGIAHDFNNFLTAIMGNIVLAKQVLDPADVLFKHLTNAETACIHARSLTQQLLTFSKGGTVLKRVSTVASIVYDTTNFVLQGSNTQPVFELASDLWQAEIDETQISRVVSNLVINAQHAMPSGGTLTVSASNLEVGLELEARHLPTPPLRPGPYIKLTLHDTGSGIPQEYLNKIFDPYFTTKQSGNGLGLAICYSIIKAHNGLITVESVPAKGTTFTIYLPAVYKSGQVRTPLTKPQERPGLWILVMDDEELILSLLDAFLSDAGHLVTAVKDGAAAIEAYQQALLTGQPFDVVLMDLIVPAGMGGQETLAAILQLDPNVKALVSSGYLNHPVTSHYRQYGFKAAISKPFDLAQLSSILYAVVDEVESQAKNLMV